jgi:hypothetical protein
MLGAVVPLKFAEHDKYGEDGEAMKELAKFYASNLALYGVGKGISLLLKPALPAARGAETFYDGAKYSPKVLQQMSKADDVLHSFPQSVDGFATKYGQWTTKTGADGKAYQWLEMRGSYGGKTGTFEFIKDPNGVINHRYLKTD